MTPSDLSFDQLIAQRDAAYWAAAGAMAAWTALLAIPLNLVGLYFVWRQLRSSADATRAASQAAEAASADSRPYMTVELSEAYVAEHQNPEGLVTKYVIHADVSGRNIGRTPAVGLVFSMYPTDGSTADLADRADAARRTLAIGPFVFPGGAETVHQQRHFTRPKVKPNDLLVLAVASYGRVGSRQRHSTPALFALRVSAIRTISTLADGSKETWRTCSVERRHPGILPLT